MHQTGAFVGQALRVTLMSVFFVAAGLLGAAGPPPEAAPSKENPDLGQQLAQLKAEMGRLKQELRALKASQERGDHLLSADGTLSIGSEPAQVTMTPGGAVAPLHVARSVKGGPPDGQAVAVSTNTVDNEDVSIKVVSTKEFSSSNLWFANTFHNVSGSLSMGVNPGTPAEMSIVFNQDASTIPSSVPPPRYTVSAGAVRTYQRAQGFGIGEEPQSTLDVHGDAYISAVGSGIILRSPDGNRWRVTVDDAGELRATAAK